MQAEKPLKNKDLIQSNEDFDNAVTNDFVGNDFIEQLEWGMLMIQQNFKQIRLAKYLPEITASHFDKAFLMTNGLKKDLKYLPQMGNFQATPDMFPNLNIKCFMITDTISLLKLKEMDLQTKKNLRITRRHGYEYSAAFYKKDTECFYGLKEGYAMHNSFFKIGKQELESNMLPLPVSLHPNYKADVKHILQHMSGEDCLDLMNKIMMCYQVAFTMYYEWCIYIKEHNSIGFTIPIEPVILSEIYGTSMLKFEDKKRMLHFVRDHYRRKVAKPDEDYSVYVKRYLRGEYKFDYRGFYAEIVPPKYELNRIKTRKKFVDALS